MVGVGTGAGERAAVGVGAGRGVGVTVGVAVGVVTGVGVAAGVSTIVTTGSNEPSSPHDATTRAASNVVVRTVRGRMNKAVVLDLRAQKAAAM
jgi:hypothetical protein